MGTQGITPELEARARYVVGEVVRWRMFAQYVVLARYWRRSEDVFLYDLRDVAHKSVKPRTYRKVPEREIMPALR